jgi:hypothetical protein
MKVYFVWLFIIVFVQLSFANIPLEQVAPAGTSGSDDAAAPTSLCHVNTNDIAMPMTQNALQELMAKYGTRPECGPRLHEALQDIFDGEIRTEGWAIPLEKLIEKAAARLSGVTVSGACHTSLCRYDIEFTDSAEAAKSFYGVDRLVIGDAVTTPLAVESIHYGTPAKYVSYFYSTVPPAAFVVPLRKRMEDGN